MEEREKFLEILFLQMDQQFFNPSPAKSNA